MSKSNHKYHSTLNDDKSIKICHLTTVHPRYDVRIFQKECLSLAAEGFETHLIVADNKGDENVSSVFIHDIGNTNGRLKRFVVSSYYCFKKAKSLNAELYHFHDPELLFVGLLLKLYRKKVIFDSHELTGRQIKTKYYIPKFLRTVIAFSFDLIEQLVCKTLDAVVVPQSYLMIPHFEKSCKKVEVIGNYVDLTECPNPTLHESLSSKKQINLLYSGTISNDRGLANMLAIMERFDNRFKLILAGGFTNEAELHKAKQHPAWSKVEYKGFVDRDTLKQLYHESDIGLILFNPVGQYIDATSPLKLFEYMLFGLPVITPNFGSWPAFEKTYQVTFCQQVDDPNSIVNSILSIVNDDNLTETISKARVIVEKEYSWQNEAMKLISLYKNILRNDNE